MKKAFGILFLLAAVGLTLVPPLCGEAFSQQTDGVFVGRGRVARRGARTPDERAPRERAPERGEPEKAPAEDELKPMVSGRTMREIVSLEQQCLDEINRQRETRGLEPLRFSEDLLWVARFYSRRMAEEKFFSHTDPEGRTVRQRVNEAGIKWRVLGENLAYSNGYVNPVAISVRGWMDSPGHRKNILDPTYRETAIGAWVGENGTVYFTEIFLK